MNVREKICEPNKMAKKTVRISDRPDLSLTVIDGRAGFRPAGVYPFEDVMDRVLDWVGSNENHPKMDVVLEWLQLAPAVVDEAAAIQEELRAEAEKRLEEEGVKRLGNSDSAAKLFAILVRTGVPMVEAERRAREIAIWSAVEHEIRTRRLKVRNPFASALRWLGYWAVAYASNANAQRTAKLISGGGDSHHEGAERRLESNDNPTTDQ